MYNFQIKKKIENLIFTFFFKNFNFKFFPKKKFNLKKEYSEFWNKIFFKLCGMSRGKSCTVSN